MECQNTWVYILAAVLSATYMEDDDAMALCKPVCVKASSVFQAFPVSIYISSNKNGNLSSPGRRATRDRG